ncbi:MAG: hypothetical protein ABJD13_00820 [Paracoccaceae bacterium]
MIPDQFAETGLAVWRATDHPITQFQVIGERSSGTNFTKRLLGRNTDLTPTEALGWKHGAPGAFAIPPNLAVILCVRRADDWARSMHAKPWHTSPALQALEFPDFLRASWDTRLDRPRYFGDTLLDGTRGQPLQPDRDPITGAQFENLFALRQSKMRAMLSYVGRDCTFVLLRMEQAVSHPETTLDALLTSFGQPARTTPFNPVVKRLGSKFKPAIGHRPQTPKHMDPDDMAFLHMSIDTKMEAALGYQYD